MNCSPEKCSSFLNNELDPITLSQFEDHLEHCSQCRNELLSASGGDAFESEVRQRLQHSREIPAWTDVSRHPLSPAHAVNSAFSPSRASPDANLPDATWAAELATLHPSDDPESLGRIGTFEAKAILGRGGMGTVYKAIDPALGRTVAIKVLRPDLASIGSARHRFSLEAKAMASIAHPHVVPIYAVDEHRGLPYLAMEYVPGGTLESRLQSQGPLELLSILRIAQQIASALQAAHECGLVHRDIKPANILLDRGVDRVRVADFGLVRVSDDASMTRSGVIAGTPQYMAPEQVRGEACDGRSDLFSLGCVIYALLVGHPPFRADTPYAAMQRIVHDTPRPIPSQRTDAPHWLAAFVDRLLAKQPHHRFASAAQVSQLLEAELVHLQNPMHSPIPERLWLAAPSTHVPLKQAHIPAAPARIPTIGWVAVTLVSSVLLAAIGTAILLPLRSSIDGKNQSGNLQSGLAPVTQPISSNPNSIDPHNASAANTTSGATTPTTSLPSTLRDTSPLWSNDGFDAFKQRMMLESLHQRDASPLPSIDPWWVETERLRSTMQHSERRDDW
jgi:serine/threonine protein kinase